MYMLPVVGRDGIEPSSLLPKQAPKPFAPPRERERERERDIERERERERLFI